jgi:hypothetical protein
MIEPITDAIFFFIGAGVTKALIEPIAKRVIKNKVMRFAPAAMKLLDDQIPGLFGELSGEEIEQLVRQKLESVTGESWSKQEIDSVFQLYDVRIGASRALGNVKENHDQ